MIRRALSGAVLALLAFLAFPPAAEVADPPRELRVAIPWPLDNLDPTMNVASVRAAVAPSLFDSLVGRDASHRIVPELARSWRLVNDLTWQLTLRRGVVFHNGEPLDAEAVRYTLLRVLDPLERSPNRANVAEIERVDVLDAHTINLVTRTPYAPLLSRLVDFPIVPPRYTAEQGSQGMAREPVGTGPYRFVSLANQERLVVEAVPRHWRGSPRIRRIVFRSIPDASARAAALRSGEVDVITTVPPALALGLERAPGIRVQRVPSVTQLFLGLNAQRRPLSDVRVRQALNHATDVEAIVRSVLHGNGRRQEGPITADMFGYDPGVKGHAPDPVRARRLLAEAGYPDGLEVGLEGPAGRYQGDKEIVEAIAGQWQRAGFKPAVRTTDWSAYFRRYLGRQFQDAYLFGVGGPMQDADELYNLVSSKGHGLYYRNDRVDALLELGRTTMDRVRRQRVYGDLARAMIQDATWVFLLREVDLYATHQRVDWRPRADRWLQFHQATLR